MSHRSLSRAGAIAFLLVLAAALSACGTKASDAGGNFRLSTDQLEPTTTSTLPQHTTTTAEAKGASLEVFKDKPVDGATAGAAPVSFSAAAVQPIPRPGLNYEFAQTTPTGWLYQNPTYFGNPLVMVVTGVEGDWLKVSITARPNGQEGWVRASDVNLTQHTFHAELVLSERLFTVWNDNTVVAQTNVVVGKDSTPTPLGTFYIAEKIPAAVAGVSPNGAYGPWILATNAYSEALEEFDGGLPAVAFHGTNQPDLIGSAASNGCIRMPDDVVSLLADTIPAGTPVTIRE
jgi:lipoprotein-anchoring transpeptidase ErfK/SrfK